MKRNFLLKITAAILIVISTLSMVGCDFNGEPHTHQYVDGECSCGKKEEHVHSFVEGECSCGEVDPNFVHNHNYELGECECGEIDSEIVTEGLVYQDIDQTTCALIGYQGSDRVIIVPEKHEGKTVTVIGESVFMGAGEIRNVILLDTITTIKENAFNGCSDLRRIHLPKNLKVIESGAFNECVKVAQIKFEAIECEGAALGTERFRNVGRQTSGVTVNVKAQVKILPDCIFYSSELDKCANIVTVKFEDNSQCKEFAYCAFFSVTSLKTVDLGLNPSLERIGDSCFGNGFCLEGFTLPRTLKYLDSWAFSNALIHAVNPVITFEDTEGWYLVKRSVDTPAHYEEYEIPFAVEFANEDNHLEEIERYRAYDWEKSV